MRRKNKNTSRAKNLGMNDHTYALRRKVMGFIYEAKKLHDIPRVDIRITEDMPKALACARVSDFIIWVSDVTVKNYTDLELRHVVFHELCHACFGTRHNMECKLMSPYLVKTTIEEQNIAFIKYANK